MISESEAIERAMTVRWDTPTQRRIIRDVLDAVFACQKPDCEDGQILGATGFMLPCPECGGTGRKQEWECRLDWGTRMFSTIEPVECMVRGPEGHRGCGWVSVIRWGGQR